MTDDYSVLFQPLKIGTMEVKNRLSVPPMGTGFAAEGGGVSERLIKYHEQRAKGGFGLIIVEVTAIDGERGIGSGHQLCLYDDNLIPGFKKLAETVHKYGTKLAVQLYHPGRTNFPHFLGGKQPVAPSAVPDPVMRQMPQELSIGEIKDLVEKFAQGARRVKEAGCDALEFHGAHGYLISEFMSAYANKRTDEYGGGFEGFMRFPLEIVKRARELVGPDFPILFRISADEVVPLGRSVPESIKMMKLLIDAGITAVDVSIGVPESSQYTSAPPDMKQGFNAETSAQFKQAFNVPILVAGRINHPSIAVDILQSGKADLVHIGRQSLTDPEWPNKVKQGRVDDIVKCLSCNEGCIEGLATWLRPSITCVQNLALGREEDYARPKAAKPRTVLIAGGGPGGLEAARTAALRGHRVILFEQDGYLGGQTKLVAIPPGKEIYCEVAQSRIKAIRQLGVEIHMGQGLTADKIREIKPDVLIIATGSEPAIPNIAGANNKIVMSARKALTTDEAGDNVLVIGGGLVGCETADYLAGKGKNVTIVEMLKSTARDIGPAARFFLRKRLKGKNVTILTQTTVQSISDEAVAISTPVGEEKLGPFDIIVLATGATSVNNLEEQARGIVSEVYVIGDAAKPGKILAAVEKAAEIALKL
ncbi:MAG: FAD-dependent oxidoreductase [Dehalococcoidia bacterium]|nr:FAD-dependent oxidoreductase [Dehalococcoidia bacterium]MDD5493526.1 FAD-dependent oxidoreductase [Dehalococcoidia bacterium]